MKRIFISAILMIIPFLSMAQKFEECEDIKLKKKEDFYATEELVIECSDYILANRIDDISQSRQRAVDFLIRWATGAPYDFVIQDWVSKLIDKDNRLLVIQLAALVKFKIENKEATEDEVQYGSAVLVYEYIKNPELGVEQKGYIKKFVAAGDAGTLKDLITP